jgi:Haem-binding domain
VTSIRLAVAAAVVLAAIQLVPVDRANPPVESTVEAPPEVLALLRRACFDCHSHETVWPPQAYVAPVSWLVAHDVSEGREELNFSRWAQTGPQRLAKLSRKVAEEVEEGEMPPALYRLAHPAARLSEPERAALTAWARTLGPGEGRSP